jgi:hypothetical protein
MKDHTFLEKAVSITTVRLYISFQMELLNCFRQLLFVFFRGQNFSELKHLLSHAHNVKRCINEGILVVVWVFEPSTGVGIVARRGDLSRRILRFYVYAWVVLLQLVKRFGLESTVRLLTICRGCRRQLNRARYFRGFCGWVDLVDRGGRWHRLKLVFWGVHFRPQLGSMERVGRSSLHSSVDSRCHWFR